MFEAVYLSIFLFGAGLFLFDLLRVVPVVNFRTERMTVVQAKPYAVFEQDAFQRRLERILGQYIPESSH